MNEKTFSSERVGQIIDECIPSNWLDPLLTGPGGMVAPPWDCRDIERLLSRVGERMKSRLCTAPATPKDQI